MSRMPMVRIIADALLDAQTDSEKIEVLKKYQNDKLFKRIVQYAHNPLIDFGLEDFNSTQKTIGKQYGMGISKFMHLPDDIYQGNLNGPEAEFAINMVLSHINVQEVDLFLGIFAKDLKLGLTLDIINKAWPGHIPEYPVMEHINFGDDLIGNWPGYILQPEYTGERINIIVKNNKVEFRNKQGKLQPDLEQYAEQFIKLTQEGKIVFDGLYNDGKFLLFDSIRYDGFVEGKDNRLGYNWRYNGIEYMAFLAKIENPCFVFAENITTATLEDAKKEVARLNKTCYLKNPAGTWFHGRNSDVQRITPDDVS